jgi:hypothetical protein
MQHLKKVLVGTLLLLSINSFADHNTLVKPREVMNVVDYKPHIGIFGGMVQPEGSYNTSSTGGIDVGYQPVIPFGLGAEFSSSQIKDKNFDTHLNRNDLLLKMTYNFGGNLAVIKESYVGFGLGASFDKDSTNWLSAPVVGFDIPLAHKHQNQFVSLGAMAKYSIYEGSQPDALSLVGVIKFWY